MDAAEVLARRPDGSAVRVREAADGGLTLSWPPPGTGGTGLRMGLMLLVFMVLWWGGWVAVLWNTVNQLANGQRPEFGMFVWLVFGAAIGAFWTRMLVLMVRPQRWESVTLGPDRFAYDPGWTARPGFMKPRAAAGYIAALKDGYQPPRRRVEVAKDQLKEFVLDRAGERQRLTFARRAGRTETEVGTTLREPEREWLFAVLEAWRRE